MEANLLSGHQLGGLPTMGSGLPNLDRGLPTVGHGLPTVGRLRTKCPDFHCTRVSVDSVNPISIFGESLLSLLSLCIIGLSCKKERYFFLQDVILKKYIYLFLQD